MTTATETGVEDTKPTAQSGAHRFVPTKPGFTYFCQVLIYGFLIIRPVNIYW